MVKVIHSVRSGEHAGGSAAIARSLWTLFNDLPLSCARCGLQISQLGTTRGSGHVHHVNGNPADNFLSNLELMCVTCHHRYHHAGLKKPGTAAAARAFMLGRPKSEATKQKLREAALRQWREARRDPIQTFLPYPDFHASARVLDDKRLGKQRLEARQILNALTGVSRGWRNHPATRMWRGYEAALAKYSDVCIKEWRRRGFRNTMLLLKPRVYVLPPWFGDPDFHASHRSNLLRKDALYYSLNGWTEGTDLEYVWPAP